MGTPVSPAVVRDWLEDQRLALHKMDKSLAGGESPDRDAQFRRIAAWKKKFLSDGHPVFSIDTKDRSILLLCDSGDSNSTSQYLFKHDLERLVNAIGLSIRVARYPSDCSKYNPADRRFFPM